MNTEVLKVNQESGIIGEEKSEREEKRMLDLYKEFTDWLAYSYPGVKLESLQEDLVKVALRNCNVKIPKTAGKAILRELAKLVLTGTR